MSSGVAKAEKDVGDEEAEEAGAVTLRIRRTLWNETPSRRRSRQPSYRGVNREAQPRLAVPATTSRHQPLNWLGDVPVHSPLLTLLVPAMRKLLSISWRRRRVLADDHPRQG